MRAPEVVKKAAARVGRVGREVRLERMRRGRIEVRRIVLYMRREVRRRENREVVRASRWETRRGR